MGFISFKFFHIATDEIAIIDQRTIVRSPCACARVSYYITLWLLLLLRLAA